MIEGKKRNGNDGTLSIWGISFTDFKVSCKEAISSSEQRKNDILTSLKNKL